MVDRCDTGSCGDLGDLGRAVAGGAVSSLVRCAGVCVATLRWRDVFELFKRREGSHDRFTLEVVLLTLC